MTAFTRHKPLTRAHRSTVSILAGETRRIPAGCAFGHLQTHMRMHIPHQATTLEICSARPHSLLIRQSLVFRQHVGQLRPEPRLSEAWWRSGWLCLVSTGSSLHSWLSPLAMKPHAEQLESTCHTHTRKGYRLVRSKGVTAESASTFGPSAGRLRARF